MTRNNLNLCMVSLSLAPGFSPVFERRPDQSRFNGLSQTGKPLKRLARPVAVGTPG
jgi:hypothetical protein